MRTKNLSQKSLSKISLKNLLAIALISIMGASEMVSQMKMNDTGEVVIGATTTPAAQLQIINTYQDPSVGNTLILGETTGSHLSLGYDDNFSWIQSLGDKPLRINQYDNDIILCKGDGEVGIGDMTNPEGKFHILDSPTDPSTGRTVVIGSPSGSNLRLGYDYGYSWIQSQGGSPLVINEAGNNVGIGEITIPQNKLHILDDSNEFQLHLTNKMLRSAGDAVSGTGIKLTNGNQYCYSISNEAQGYWGHTNSFEIRQNDGHLAFQIYEDHQVNANHWLNVQYWTRISTQKEGTTGDADGFNFNPLVEEPGFILEQGRAESSGIQGDHDYVTIWSPGDQNRLVRVFDEDGMIEKFFIDGAGVPHTSSDSSRKQSVRRIEFKKDKLKKIRAVKFNYKKEDQSQKKNTKMKNESDSVTVDNNKYDPSTEDYYGFIAQEVERIYPDLVDTNEDGDKFISYTEFIPILVEAYKDQEEVVEAQKELIESLTKRVKDLESRMDVVESDIDDCCNDKNAPIIQPAAVVQSGSTVCSLEQNIPNPFTTSTQINYTLAETASSAAIYIYNMAGKQIKGVPLAQHGQGTVTIQAGELAAGMYMYTLIVDGEVIDTKKMILTD